MRTLINRYFATVGANFSLLFSFIIKHFCKISLSENKTIIEINVTKLALDLHIFLSHIFMWYFTPLLKEQIHYLLELFSGFARTSKAVTRVDFQLCIEKKKMETIKKNKAKTNKAGYNTRHKSRQLGRASDALKPPRKKSADSRTERLADRRTNRWRDGHTPL